MPKPEYKHNIDSLRALAVLLVVFYHFDFTLFKGGFIGVDVFFVISGYLITRIIHYEYRSNLRFNFSNFYFRRAKRLLPSLLLTIIISFVFSFLLFSPSDFASSTNSMFYSSIAVSNFYFLGETGYFERASELMPLLHTWSLGIEEQFYFIWPTLFVIFLRAFSKSRLPVIIGILLLISLFFNCLFVIIPVIISHSNSKSVK